MAKLIWFTCSDCGDMFCEPVQAFVDEPADEVAAPMLCSECGHGDDD